MPDLGDNIVVHKGERLLDALNKIDANTLGFVIGLNEKEEVCATLTDGDIRRFIIHGGCNEDPVENAWKTDFTYITEQDRFNDAIDLFKDKRIHFLPILGKDKKLINVLPKEAMHALLLQDIHPDLDYDFLSVDAGIIDYEIFQRPWGFYKTTILSENFQSKIISVAPEASLSLQMHKRREEHWIIVHGNGRVVLGESEFNVYDGNHIFIPKGCKHRLTNLSDTESLIMIEVQCGDYFGEDDIIRFDDIYGRE